MNIDFTKEEFRALLDLVTLGDWVISAHDTESDPSKDTHEKVLQKIFSLAGEFGCGDLVVFDDDSQQFYETVEYEDSGKDDFLEEYNDITFWEQLISRLAERDFIREHGLERAMDMSFEDRLRGLYTYEQKYSGEFEEHGIDRLQLDDR